MKTHSVDMKVTCNVLLHHKKVDELLWNVKCTNNIPRDIFRRKLIKRTQFTTKYFDRKNKFTETWTSEKKGIEETLNQKWNKC